MHACGSTTTLAINWNNLNNEKIEKYPIRSFTCIRKLRNCIYKILNCNILRKIMFFDKFHFVF